MDTTIQYINSVALFVPASVSVLVPSLAVVGRKKRECNDKESMNWNKHVNGYALGRWSQIYQRGKHRPGGCRDEMLEVNVSA